MPHKTRPAADCHPDRPHWARGFCVSCYQTWWKETHPEQFKARPRRKSRCHPDKNVLARGLCSTCYRTWWRAQPGNLEIEQARNAVAQRKKYQDRTPEERRAIVIRRHGLTRAEFDRMVADQGGGCAACGGVPAKRPLQIDHCHDTGQIRGILCGNCNSALGHAKDDVARLESLIVYLKRSRGRELAENQGFSV